MGKQQQIDGLLERGTDQIIQRQSLAKKLASGRSLRVKFGVDPTAPKLHLGHVVLLRKLREFQALGHQAIFLVGSFTARIGDPSDKLTERKPLSNNEIEHNMKQYRKQVGKILDLSKIEIRYNNEWHSNMDFAELFQLASLFSVNQMLERDMYQERLKRKKPLWIHELLYPLLQGYDSVALRADVEIGGTDQTFNMLAARTIQPYYNQLAQDILTCPLIEGVDGSRKMSKSLGNTIDLDLPANDMYGKVMSIPDKLILKYFTLLTDKTAKEIQAMERGLQKGENPRTNKAMLAREIVAQLHSTKEALSAEKEFTTVFHKKQAPTSMPSVRLKKKTLSAVDLLVETGLASSKSEARRFIEQGGVSLDAKKITDWQSSLNPPPGAILKVGKRKFVRIA